LARLVATCALPLGIRLNGTPSGFMIAFGPGAAYESPNYRWFCARFPDFLYVDRIVVDAARRGSGLGRALYAAAFEAAGERPVCCEVNLRPPNPDSLAFHARIGLFEIGRQELDGGRKEVAMLASQPLPL
jgi:predicted GNAT superfamily acetyltransferase